MKRILLLSLILSLAMCIFSCEKVDHDQVMSEIGEQNKIYHEKRQEFLDSEVCKTAKEYVAAALEELVPGCTVDISLEPGKLLEAELSKYADFSENEDTRIDFFSKTELSFRVNFWDFDIDGQTLAERLVEKQISGKMMSGKVGSDYYELDAVTGKAVFIQVPEV